LKENKPFTKENLEQVYVRRRRESWVDAEAKVAARARDGFSHGVVAGLIGMGLAGFSKGKLFVPARQVAPHERIASLEEYLKDQLLPYEIDQIKKECADKGQTLHDALMDRIGWPAIPYDGKLLVSQQDALLLGGKTMATAGYRDHVIFRRRELCENCKTKVCVEICSGQAIAPGPDGGAPAFDREKCLHCGACLWNCAQPLGDGSGRTNLKFTAGSGGLHSAEN
jgi:electron-transferring-flavoprotein dehydrogenase